MLAPKERGAKTVQNLSEDNNTHVSFLFITMTAECSKTLGAKGKTIKNFYSTLLNRYRIKI